MFSIQNIGITIILVMVSSVLTRLYVRYKKKARAEDLVEYHKIARVRIHPYCCHTCKKPLQHNDLIVWAEKKNGWQSPLSHAKCVIIIRHPEGTITTLEGKPLRTNSYGGVIDPLPIGALLLTKDEWDSGAPPTNVEVLGPGDPPGSFPLKVQA